jgi:hypothetical protein
MELFPSLGPGSELGWGTLGAGPEPYNNTLDQYRYVVFQDPNWVWRSFDFDSDNRDSVVVNVAFHPSPVLQRPPGQDLRGGRILTVHVAEKFCVNVSPHLKTERHHRHRPILESKVEC